MCNIKLTAAQKRKKVKGLCITPFCMKKAAAKKNNCYTCVQKKYAERHPYEYAFNNHKQNSKQRKIECTLTLEQFKKFAVRTFYMDKKGKHYNGLHMDRIDENHGYHDWNIQALPNHENVKKYHASRKALSEAPF